MITRVVIRKIMSNQGIRFRVETNVRVAAYTLHPNWNSAFSYATGYKAALHDKGYSTVFIDTVDD